jgi:hypothetical protein
MLDWRNPQDYIFTQRLTAAQWAWEFLRRNPLYQAEWRDFIAAWRALEAQYGKPSKRDIAAWKRDPRAWVPAERCGESDCRVDGNKVLIECALGARWGFYKFPPDPQDDDPVGGERLVWREERLEIPLLEAEATAPSDLKRAALVFDLGLPLAPQLEQAKRRLQIEQRRRIREGRLVPPCIADHAANLAHGLQLLDAAAAGAPIGEQARILGIGTKDVERTLKQALALRDGGYRDLLRLH